MVRKSKKDKGQTTETTSNPSPPSPLPSPPLSDLVPISFGTITPTKTLNPSPPSPLPSPPLSDPVPISSPPPSVPVPISSGSTGTEYEVHKEHIITDPNTSHSMRYYEGIIIHKVGEHKRHNKDVCFLALDDLDVANKIYEFSSLINHPRVMKASSIFFDDFLNQYLVCFDKFEGLENAKKVNRLAKQLDDPPKLFGTVPGYPCTFVQEEIKGLAEGLDYMLENNVSSSFLNRAFGYVWCPLTSHVKIMSVDISLKNEGKPDKTKVDTLNQFRNGLNKYFLKTSDDPKTSEDLKTTEDPSEDTIWPLRGQFLKSFMRSGVPLQNRMKMVIDHFFLETDIQNILHFFSMVSHSLKSQSTYRGRDLTNFGKAINDPHFIQEFCGGVNGWKKDNWSKEFQEAFEFQAAFVGDGAGYDTKNMKHFIRFIRNIYEHKKRGKADKAGLQRFFEEIQRCWPLLIGELYELER